MLYAFKRLPSLSGDFSLIKVGLLISKEKLVFVFLGLFLFIGITFGLFYVLQTHLFLAASKINTWIPFGILLSLFAIMGFKEFNTFGYSQMHKKTVISTALHLLKNIKHSARFNYIRKKDRAFFQSKNQYENDKLKEHPNIIIIAIESYGSLVYQDKFYQSYFEEKLSTIEQSTANKGWKMTSVLSNPPIFAGGSWLSYSSFLYGIDINDGILYDLLLTTQKEFQHYQSLLHFLQNNEYKNHLLSSIGASKKDIDWGKITRAYNMNQFWGFDNIKYEGQHLTYLDFRKTIPDEYALNYTYEKIKTQNAPFSLFFSTVNSHCFYETPIQTMQDWRDYNNKSFETTDGKKKNLAAKYKKAIDYQLSYIEEFLVKQDPENTIVILFGDHQPRFVAKQSDGKSTPIHILSKHSNFVDAFKTHGFANNTADFFNQSTTIEHASFYSRFMDVFLKFYGTSTTDSNIYPNGVPLK